MKIEVEIPDKDKLIVREGVLVVYGWLENGTPCWKPYSVQEASIYTMSDLCRRAHIHLERQNEQHKPI